MNTNGGSKQARNEKIGGGGTKSNKIYLWFPDKYNKEFSWWRRKNDSNTNRLNSFNQVSKWGVFVYTAFVSIR